MTLWRSEQVVRSRLRYLSTPWVLFWDTWARESTDIDADAYVLRMCPKGRDSYKTWLMQTPVAPDVDFAAYETLAILRYGLQDVVCTKVVVRRPRG